MTITLAVLLIFAISLSISVRRAIYLQIFLSYYFIIYYYYLLLIFIFTFGLKIFNDINKEEEDYDAK